MRARACACVRVRARACACVRVRARACACVRVRARACEHARACLRDVFAIYDNNISPRLIMIIIKIILSYISYKSDTPVDGFPSKGTRLVLVISGKHHIL